MKQMESMDKLFINDVTELNYIIMEFAKEKNLN
jgi:hypothetical protein